LLRPKGATADPFMDWLFGEFNPRFELFLNKLDGLDNYRAFMAPGISSMQREHLLTKELKANY
jgi:hypothetical protein